MKTLVKVLAAGTFAVTCSGGFEVRGLRGLGSWSGHFSAGDISLLPHLSATPPAPEHFVSHFGHFRGRHHVFFDFVDSSWEWPYDGSYYRRYYCPDYPIYDSEHWVAAGVQAALGSCRSYSGAIDGLVGLPTRDAIMRYQARWGLEVTGLIDQRLIDSLGLG